MQKNLWLAFIIQAILIADIYSQNPFPQYEREALMELMNQGEVDPSEIDTRIQRVTSFYRENPSLLELNAPNGQLKFDSLIHVPGVSKERLFNRVKEFTSIFYGHIDEVLHYEDYSSGTLILKGKQSIYKNRYLGDWESLFNDEAFSIRYLSNINFIVKIRIDHQIVKIELMQVELIGPDDSAITQGIPVSRIFPLVKMRTEPGVKAAAEAIEGVANSVYYHLKSFNNYLVQTLEDDDWKD